MTRPTAESPVGSILGELASNDATPRRAIGGWVPLFPHVLARQNRVRHVGRSGVGLGEKHCARYVLPVQGTSGARKKVLNDESDGMVPCCPFGGSLILHWLDMK